MLRKLLPIGTLLLFVAALMIAPQATVFADGRRYDHRPQYRVPPGHQWDHHKWVPPGHRKHADRYRASDCDRYDRDRYRDRRYTDTRSYRYEPRKQRRYDRDNQDYGLIIRKGPHGTTVDVEYRNRDW